MRLPGILWFRNEIAGKTWQHRLVTDTVLTEKNDGGECWAVTVQDDAAVYYWEDASYEDLCLLFLHETHHKGAMIPGDAHRLHEIYGTNEPDLFTNREEGAAGYYARIYREALGPYLRLPKPPRRKKK